MEPSQVDIERFVVLEHIRKTAESNYYKNPYDADNLTKWGVALLEVSQFCSLIESNILIKDAVSKLEEALVINPKKHEALWCLGNALTTQGLMILDISDAQAYFDKAFEYFQKAVDECPGHDTYLMSLRAAPKAAEMHMEVHRQQGVRATTSNAKAATSDLKYDICGWIILGVGILAWVAKAKSNVPPIPR